MPFSSFHQLLSDLRYGRLNSALAHRLLALVYWEGNVYTVPFGRLRGVKLQYDQKISFLAMLGLWETESFDLRARILNAGVLPDQVPVICDVGTSLGLYTIILARHQPTGTVYAFETTPVVNHLRTNLGPNHGANVVVIEQACSYRIDEVLFYLRHHHHTSSLHVDWSQGSQNSVRTIRMPTTTLDGYFCGAQPQQGPYFIKMDIENDGTFALKKWDWCIQKVLGS